MDKLDRVLIATLIILAMAVLAIFISMVYFNASQPEPVAHDEILVEIECNVIHHKIFYDRETGVMYIENTSKGGMVPMYNKDGTLKIYTERNNR